VSDKVVQTKNAPKGDPRDTGTAPGRGSTVEEAAGSHAIYVSQPAAVAALIEKAASEVSSATR